MIKIKKIVDLEQLKIIRDVATKINGDLAVTEKVKQELTLKLLNVYNSCSHELVVRYKDNQFGRIARCLCCTKTVYGPMVDLDCYFQNIIDLPNTLDENDKTQFALNLFEQERANHPNLSDAEIVAIINEQLRSQTISTGEPDFVKSIGTKKSYQ